MTSRPSCAGRHRVGGGEHDLALGRARRRVDAGGEHLERRLGIEGGVQQRVERVGVDRQQRPLAVEQPLRDGVDREAHRRLGRPLGVARLEHVELPLLDRELRVLHVLVVGLERAQDLHQLLVDLGHPLLHLRDVTRRAHPGDDVLALRVGQEVPAGLGRAGDLVARERHARARGVALVAEHHLLDVDRRAPLVRDVVQAPVGDRALAHPGVEHRPDGQPQLLLRVLRELVAGVLGVDLLERLGELA